MINNFTITLFLSIIFISLILSLFSSFYLKLLKVKKYREENGMVAREPGNERNVENTGVSNFSIKDSKLSIFFSFFMVIFGLLLTFIFLTLAQNHKRDNPEEKNFLYSFTLSSIFTIFPFIGYNQILVVIMDSIAFHGLCLLFLCFLFPALSLDDYVDGYPAWYFTPITFVIILNIYYKWFGECQGEYFIFNILDFFFDIVFVLWYASYFILLESLKLFN